MNEPKQVDERYYQLMHELQALDFVLVELTLYLDTHSDDAEALNQFNRMAEQRWNVACEFERHYGPLLQFGLSYSGYPWQWNDTPWPWQV
ncbi:spore coat protein CotJB [Brevibacillus composti]|uniref:Spore coat protein CotJB n=1 Tax=Brevibacillus composti TaxID=2796470 RepID=A0A7T5ENP5_9BACL|nr:spore coat protein CotJB [Brevibacillus composti]QQE75935.1 spore coat protein CotJB [Brevibacillus composti]QUO42961.1 spore coat protein CotJB [Brevibacillus composti]